jgi:hypothetical protein
LLRLGRRQDRHAGLSIDELSARGDLKRRLVRPGGLVEHRQDDLRRRFNLDFDVFTTDRRRP